MAKFYIVDHSLQEIRSTSLPRHVLPFPYKATQISRSRSSVAEWTFQLLPPGCKRDTSGQSMTLLNTTSFYLRADQHHKEPTVTTAKHFPALITPLPLERLRLEISQEITPFPPQAQTVVRSKSLLNQVTTFESHGTVFPHLHRRMEGVLAENTTSTRRQNCQFEWQSTCQRPLDAKQTEGASHSCGQEMSNNVIPSSKPPSR